MASLRFSPFSSCTELSLPVPDPSGTRFEPTTSGWSKRSLELYFGTIGSENKILRRFILELSTSLLTTSLRIINFQHGMMVPCRREGYKMDYIY
ncbi:hypothetical protein L1887_14512 [Cichorium endivia]|nr:hypothetical protein L1887_14512 [Cichorium endivia]